LSRKPAILITLIFLLLIGGGAVAFYLHLRAQAPPLVSEVDAFLEDPRISGGWEKTWEPMRDSGCIVKMSWNPLSDGTPISQRTYSFKRGVFERARVIVTYPSDSKRIDEITIKADPAGAVDFKRLLLERFPTLRHVLHVIP